MIPARRLAVGALVLVLLAGCSRNGNSQDVPPTLPPAFVVVTPTPVPPGATVVITPTPTIDVSTLQKYTVKSGDSLSSIAAQFGVTQDALAQINKIDDPNSLEAGQVLLIPPK